MANEDYYQTQMMAQALQPSGTTQGAQSPGGMQPSAPTSPQHQAQRQSIWGRFFQRLRDDPNFAMQLGALGMGLTMPAANTYGQIGQGVAMMHSARGLTEQAGAQQAAAAQKQTQAQREMDLEERRVKVDEERLKAQTSQGYYNRRGAGGSKEVEKLSTMAEMLRKQNPSLKFEDAYMKAYQLYSMGTPEAALKDLYVSQEFIYASPETQEAMKESLLSLFAGPETPPEQGGSQTLDGWTVERAN